MKKVDELLARWDVDLSNDKKAAARMEIIFNTNAGQKAFVSEVRDIYHATFHRPFDITNKCGCPAKVIRRLKELQQFKESEQEIEIQIIKPSRKRKQTPKQ